MLCILPSCFYANIHMFRYDSNYLTVSDVALADWLLQAGSGSPTERSIHRSSLVSSPGPPHSTEFCKEAERALEQRRWQRVRFLDMPLESAKGFIIFDICVHFFLVKMHVPLQGIIT